MGFYFLFLKKAELEPGDFLKQTFIRTEEALQKREIKKQSSFQHKCVVIFKQKQKLSYRETSQAAKAVFVPQNVSSWNGNVAS